jgi:hypothetical protein
MQTDATSTAFCWLKGSKNPNINEPIRHALANASKKGIFVQCQHIPGVRNRRADWLSRNVDPKNYRLEPEMFQNMCHHFKIWPMTDLFANRRNKQCPMYCSWRVDPKSLGNAFAIPWNRGVFWMNPPWDIILKALLKAKEDRTHALICLPVWKTAIWWPLLQSLLSEPPVIIRNCPLFANPKGEQMPPPRWATLFGVIGGPRQWQ